MRLHHHQQLSKQFQTSMREDSHRQVQQHRFLPRLLLEFQVGRRGIIVRGLRLK